MAEIDTEFKPDMDVSRWVFEFLLHQSLDYTLLTSLAKVLPLPSNNYKLTKTVLLRKIDHELSGAAATDSILRVLEQIEELEYLNGVAEVSDDFKAAYFAVSGMNFVNYFKSKKGKTVKKQYYDEMKQMWKWRVSRGALFGELGLVAREFLCWKDDIAAMMKGGVGDAEVRGLENVRVYVDNEMKKLSPTFLEIVAGNGAVISAINDDRNKFDLLDVSRGVEPVTNAELGVVASNKEIDGLPTPELKEGCPRDTSCSADTPVSCTVVRFHHDSEVKTKTRRQRKRWSKEEEDVLRNAVEKYGKGKWKFILSAYQHIFLERTEVDLKDKWRNMSRT